MTFTKLPKAISAEELLSTPLPPVKWIIPGLLPAGLALFAGPSKAGKSWLTLWLCLQIAQGNPVWNREIEPRTVIYFSLEDTFNRLQSRIFQLIDGGDAPERLILQTEWLNGAGYLSRNTYASGRWDMNRAGIRPRRYLIYWIN